MHCLKPKGNATLLVLAMGVIFGIAATTAGRFLRVKNNNLLREIENMEGFYASELAALNAYANEFTGDQDLELTGAEGPSEWGMRRFDPDSISTKNNGDDHCGVAQIDSDSPAVTVCLRKVASETPPGGGP